MGAAPIQPTTVVDVVEAVVITGGGGDGDGELVVASGGLELDVLVTTFVEAAAAPELPEILINHTFCPFIGYFFII